MKQAMMMVALALASVGCGVDPAGVLPPDSVGKYAPVTAPACAARVSTSVLEGTPCVLCWATAIPDASAGGDRVEACAAEVCADGFRPEGSTCADGSSPTARLCIASPEACPLKGAQ